MKTDVGGIKKDVLETFVLKCKLKRKLKHM
jgi:hypothetical protein